MPTLSQITGGTVKFIEGKVDQEQQGWKAIYTLGERTYFILLDDSVVAVDDSKHVGTPLKRFHQAPKGG